MTCDTGKVLKKKKGGGGVVGGKTNNALLLRKKTAMKKKKKAPIFMENSERNAYSIGMYSRGVFPCGRK